MSRNGTGTYNLPAGNPVVTGTVIASTWANSTLTDIASALTGSVAADGQTPMTGDLDLNTNKILNLDPGTVAGNAIEYDQFVAATTTNVNITGGSINGTSIGETTRSSGKFTTLDASGNLSASGTLAVTGAATLSSTLGVTGYATFSSNGEFNGTGALKLPVGTTAQQPTPATGMLRFNNSLTKFEGYNGTVWGSIGDPAGSNTQIQYNNSGVFGASSAFTFNGTTLVVPNISDGTSTISTGNSIKGSAKAFCSFAGATGTIAGSFNISSVTRAGTGDYTASFTTALPNANYTVIGSCSPTTGYGSVSTVQTNSVRSTATITSNTTSSFQFSTVASSVGNAVDPVNVYFSVFSA